MHNVPSSDVRGWARRAGFVVLAALCATGMLASAASAASVAAKKPKPKGSSSLQNIASSLKSDEKATFSATYTLQSSSSKGTFVYEQKPPNYRVNFKEKSASASFIQLGKHSYVCTAAGGLNLCIPESSSLISADLNWFAPGQVLTKIEGLEAEAALTSKGASVANSTKTFAGQSSNCVTVTYKGVKSTYCVTDSGILAYAGTSAGGITLTAFSGSPPASDFALPKGARIQG